MSTTSGARPSAAGARPVEADDEQARVQHDERAEHDRAEARGEHEVGVGDAEHVAEEQLLQPRGRVGRQREQRAEAEQAGDDDGDRRVVPDRRRARPRPRRASAATISPAAPPTTSGAPASEATTSPGSRACASDSAL